MEVNLKIVGTLHELTSVGDGPFSVVPGTNVAGLLRALGLDQVTPLLVVIDGHLAKADERLTAGSEVRILMGASGG